MRFWLAEVVVAGLAFIIVFVTTDDPSWAAAATLLAAVLTFLGGLVWKVWVTTSEERRKYRAAIVRLEARSEFPGSVDVEATSPSQMEQNLERFRTYVDEQIVKLGAVFESAQLSVSGTEEFMRIARRTSSGIRRFDSSLGDYVDKAIDELSDDYDEISLLSLGGINSILEAVNESRVLYDGRDPVVPF